MQDVARYSAKFHESFRYVLRRLVFSSLQRSLRSAIFMDIIYKNFKTEE